MIMTKMAIIMKMPMLILLRTKWRPIDRWVGDSNDDDGSDHKDDDYDEDGNYNEDADVDPAPQ